MSAVKALKYSEAVRAEGDEFFNASLTPSGTLYSEAMEFLKKIAHTGDLLPTNAGLDAPLFIHDSTSYATTTHINHTAHACAATAPCAAAKAMRKYATTRVANQLTMACSLTLHTFPQQSPRHSCILLTTSRPETTCTPQSYPPRPAPSINMQG